MYRIMLTADACQEDNNTLLQLIAFNDSLARVNKEARTILKQQLDLRTSQYENEQLKYQQAEDKFTIVDETLSGMKLRKNIYIASSVGLAILVVIQILK